MLFLLKIFNILKYLIDRDNWMGGGSTVMELFTLITDAFDGFWSAESVMDAICMLGEMRRTRCAAFYLVLLEL